MQADETVKNSPSEDAYRAQDIRHILEQITAPIKAVVSHVEDLKRGKVPQNKIQGKLSYISKLSKISLKYAENFEKALEFDSQQVVPRRERLYDLRDYLIGFAREYQPLIRNKLIHINITKETPSNINLYVDKDLFSRAISNIIDNIVKYSFSPEERERLGFNAKPHSTEDIESVLITAKEEGDVVTISFSSLGLEILEDEREKIFNKGFRGQKARERFNVGTGIGLYIAKEIIELHGGKLELIPQPNKYNTVFKITVPRGEAA